MVVEVVVCATGPEANASTQHRGSLPLKEVLLFHNYLINSQDFFRTIILYLLTFKSLPHSYPGGSQLWCNTWGDMVLFGHVSAPLKIFYFSTTT